MAKETHVFELLAIDQSGNTEITSVKSMAMGLSYSEKLWKKPTVKASSVEDKGLGITLSIQKAGDIEDETEAAFIIKVKSNQLEKADEFRYGLLHHIKDKLAFTNIRVLKDSVSETLAKNIYLSLTEAESTLRSTLAHHFMQQHGLNWWEAVAPKAMVTKINKRKNAQSALGELIDNDIVYTDYQDLNALAQKAFTNKQLQSKLESLAAIKEQTAFNNLFEKEDLEKVEQLVAEATALLNGQEAPKPAAKPAKKAVKKPAAKKVAQPKAAPKKAETPKATPKPSPTPSRPAVKTTTPVKEEKVVEPAFEERPDYETPAAVDTVPEPKPEPAPVPKKEPVEDLSNDAFMMITENKLLEELRAIEAVQNGEINIKNFVKDTLARKGYMSGPAFGLAESMKDKGLVDIYETKDDQGFMIKVIRSN